MAIEVEVIIDEEGHAQIHVKGAKGMSCKKLTEELERALGTVTERHYTPEATVQTQTQGPMRQGG